MPLDSEDLSLLIHERTPLLVSTRSAQVLKTARSDGGIRCLDLDIADDCSSEFMSVMNIGTRLVLLEKIRLVVFSGSTAKSNM